MNVVDAAKELGITAQTIRTWIYEGRIIDVKKGGPGKGNAHDLSPRAVAKIKAWLAMREKVNQKVIC